MAARFNTIARIGSMMLLGTTPAIAQRAARPEAASAAPAVPQPSVAHDNTPANVLSAEAWRRVDAGVRRALDWLATQQQPNGSFATLNTGQPGVTSLCIMAFVSHGHIPGDKSFGKGLERATDFVISCQKPNGLVTLMGPDGPEISRNIDHEIGTC